MSPSGNARRPRCPPSTMSPTSLGPSPSSPASSSAPSWGPSQCSTTACAGNPTAGGDPASAGCTEAAQPGSALGRLGSIHAPLQVPAPACCKHNPVDHERKFCSWSCFGFSQSPPRWCQAASASGEKPPDQLPAGHGLTTGALSVLGGSPRPPSDVHIPFLGASR